MTLGHLRLLAVAAVVLIAPGCSWPNDHRARREAAAVGLLRQGVIALKAYHDACGGYPEHLADVLDASGECVAELPSWLWVDDIQTLASGSALLDYRWSYRLCGARDPASECQGYQITSEYVGHVSPGRGRRWRVFRATGTTLSWEYEGLFGTVRETHDLLQEGAG